MLLNNKKVMKYFSLKCRYEKGMIVYNEHDLCDRLGMIHSGELKLIHYTLNGDERILATLKKGDVFGDFLINSITPFYPGNLVVSKGCELSFLEKDKLNHLLKTNDLFRHYYLSQLSHKALVLNQHNKILLQPNLEEKIAMWLSYESLSSQDNKIKISSKEELANYFNVARPSLSRTLSKMKENGVIDYDRDYIYLL